MLVRCPDCHEMAEAIVVDNGIGSYEFWGQKCFQSSPEVVSNCCEAPLEITPFELKEEEEIICSYQKEKERKNLNNNT